MAVHQLKKDGRWIVRFTKGTLADDPERTREYFGRGAQAEAAARKRNEELGFGRRRTRKKPTGPLFSELAVSYLREDRFNANSRKMLSYRLSVNILPFFGPLVATGITPDDMRRYVAERRKATRPIIDRTSIKKIKKNGMTRRHVPIHDGFAEELKSWWKADKKTGPIIHYKNKPAKRIQTTWENTLIRAKIKRRIRPYDLRHIFITAAIEDGADIGAVVAIVGSSPETLRKHYQHVTNRLRRHTVALIKTFEE